MPKYYKVDPVAFTPFNDSPHFIKGEIGKINNVFKISGHCKKQTSEWYNIGGRTGLLQPHSFKFYALVKSKYPVGAYSIGINGKEFPSIYVSHFLHSNVELYSRNIGRNFFSGFSFDNNGDREQYGVKSPEFNSNDEIKLEIEYDSSLKELYCYANGDLIHKRKAVLKEFSLELRLELVGVECDYDIEFVDLTYISNDEDSNIKILNGWSPDNPPIFISYSHSDEDEVAKIKDRLNSEKVLVKGDWDFEIGDSLIKNICSYISSSSIILAIISKSSIQSTWVEMELEIAINLNQYKRSKLKVIPVLLDDCEIPTYLIGKIYYKYDEDFALLLRAIRQYGYYK